MKRFLPFLLLLSCASTQVLEPAEWTVSPSIKTAKAGDIIDLRFSVTIDKNWYLYSNEFPCEDGPIKATVTFIPHGSYELVDGWVAVNPVSKRDEIFDCDVKIFKGKGEFIQRIRLLGSPVKISGNYEYQVCSDVDGKCIPFDEDFQITGIEVTGGTTITADTLKVAK